MDSYIILFKGDDSDFTDNQTIEVKLDTTLDLTNCKATFKFLDYVQTFDSIPATKILTLTFPADQTKLWSLGSFDAEMWLTDANNRRRTVANRIHIVITKSVKEAYESEDTQAITVNFSGGGCSWDKITNKPESFPPSEHTHPWDEVTGPLTQNDVFDMECSDWQFRKVCARLWTELGGKVENND